MAKPLGSYKETEGDRYGMYYMTKNGVRTLTHQHPTSYSLATTKLSTRVYTLKGKTLSNSRTFFDIPNHMPFVNGFWNYGSTAVRDTVHNKALSKVHEDLGQAAGFFETWYERQKAADLLKHRAQQLLTIVASLTNPKKAAKLLKRKLSKAEASDIPSLWLEYNFAIKPLMYAYEDAVAILAADMPRMFIRGRSSADLTSATKSQFWEQDLYAKYQVEIGVTVTGFNSNVVAATKLGITQPLTSGWAVIPWSWAIDYFVNVGEFLSNFEPRFPGLILEDWYLTQTAKGSLNRRPNAYGIKEQLTDQVFGTFCACNRRLTKSNFKFTYNPSPLNMRQSSYLTSAIALTMKGKSK